MLLDSSRLRQANERRDRQTDRYEREMLKLKSDFEHGIKTLRSVIEYQMLDTNWHCGSLNVREFQRVFCPITKTITDKAIRGALRDIRETSGLQVRPIGTFTRYWGDALDPETIEALLSGHLRGVRIEHGQYIDLGRAGLAEPPLRVAVYLDNLARRRGLDRSITLMHFDLEEIDRVGELGDMLGADPALVHEAVEAVRRRTVA